MFDDVYRITEKAIDHELRPLCTLRYSFNSIALVSREEKRVKISVEKWNEKKKNKQA